MNGFQPVSTPSRRRSRKAFAPCGCGSAPSRNSKALVQLGAYRSSERVRWLGRSSEEVSCLANYSPVRARYDSAKGTVWRLSVRGFGNQQ